MTVALPPSHLDLFHDPVHGVLTTVMPDGQPQSSIVWVDYDGEFVLINTTLERQKGRNMLANPNVTLLVLDPENLSRWIQVRGCVRELSVQDAETHADNLTRRYSRGSKKHFYGDIYPLDQKQRETRVIVKIAPLHVSLDAIFK